MQNTDYRFLDVTPRLDFDFLAASAEVSIKGMCCETKQLTNHSLLAPSVVELFKSRTMSCCLDFVTSLAPRDSRISFHGACERGIDCSWRSRFRCDANLLSYALVRWKVCDMHAYAIKRCSRRGIEVRVDDTVELAVVKQILLLLHQPAFRNAVQCPAHIQPWYITRKSHHELCRTTWAFCK